jgi:uncharacterized membrane protein YecN with MAPEG domain
LKSLISKLLVGFFIFGEGVVHKYELADEKTINRNCGVLCVWKAKVKEGLFTLMVEMYQ